MQFQHTTPGEVEIVSTGYEKTRKHFTTLLSKYKLFGNVAEVGVYRGAFSKMMLDAPNWDCNHYYMIDMWTDIPGYVDAHSDTMNMHNQKEHDENYAAAKQSVWTWYHSGKCTLIKSDSVSAGAKFDDEFFDFIYIDAAHTYNNVSADMGAWWPKLRQGGIFAGDDYTINPYENTLAAAPPNEPWGVHAAVQEFAVNHRKNVSLDICGDWYYRRDEKRLVPCRNWYMVK